jgi:hypothetical protein
LTLYLHEPYLTQRGGYGHDPSRVVARDSSVGREHLGLRNPLATPCLAWLALLAAGLVAALTGQIDATLFGHAIAGERFPFAAGLAASGFALWWLGGRSDDERLACLFTLATAGVAFLAAPISFVHGAAGWWLYQIPVWLAHVGLCAQLVAWREVAHKAQRIGLLIMAIGLFCEAFGIFPVAQLIDVDAACTAGMTLTCVSGSAAVAMALPAAVTLALVLLWLNPLTAALRGHAGQR